MCIHFNFVDTMIGSTKGNTQDTNKTLEEMFFLNESQNYCFILRSK